MNPTSSANCKDNAKVKEFQQDGGLGGIGESRPDQYKVTGDVGCEQAKQRDKTKRIDKAR
jgi:hypothetical protein